jgi:hypothetical protein
VPTTTGTTTGTTTPAVQVRLDGGRTTALHLDEIDLRRFWDSSAGTWTTVLDEGSGLLWDLVWVERTVHGGAEDGRVEGFEAHARVSLLNAG